MQFPVYTLNRHENFATCGFLSYVILLLADNLLAAEQSDPDNPTVQTLVRVKSAILNTKH